MGIVGPLKPFQAEDLPFFLSHKRAAILYEMRMGKTVEVVNIIGADPTIRTIFIICSKNALFVWRSHLYDWLPFLNPGCTLDIRMVRGTAEQRRQHWQKPVDQGITYTAYVITAAAFIRDVKSPDMMPKGFKPHMVVPDEYHKYMINPKSKTFEYLKPIIKTCIRYHPTSGTPTNKGPYKMWTMLYGCNPTLFSSYWRFVATFHHTFDNGFGKEIGEPKNIPQFQLQLRSYARVRTRAETKMPGKSRGMIPVEMTEPQALLYKELNLGTPRYTDDGKVIVAATSMERIMRMRQILTCPAILDRRAGVGASIESFADMIIDECDTPEDRNVVLFTDMAKALDPFQAYLASRGLTDVYQLRGGIEPEQLEQRIAWWRKSQGIMLCTIPYAQAFSLEPAKACYVIGLNWDPDMNAQAEDRLIPQEGTNPIDCLYYVNEGTIETGVVERVAMKQGRIDLTLGVTRNVTRSSASIISKMTEKLGQEDNGVEIDWDAIDEDDEDEIADNSED